MRLNYRGLGPGLGVAALSAFLLFPGAAGAQTGSGFTYQGRLNESGTPAAGLYDFSFGLYTAAADGTQIGTTVTQPGVTVTGGLFTAPLDFGPGAFNGESRWLETTVAPAGGSTPVTLAPRTPVTGAPFSHYALKTASPAQTVTVARSGGDFDTVTAALASITNATSTTRYVIRIAPGLYQERVVMKPYVSLQGMDQKAVILRWTGGTFPPTSSSDTYTLVTAPHSSVENLTVESVASPATYAGGINSTAANVRISGVAVRAHSAREATAAFETDSTLWEECTLSAEGSEAAYGIYENGAGKTPAFRHVRVTATGSGPTYGILSVGSTGRIDFSHCDFNVPAAGYGYAALIGNGCRVTDTTFAGSATNSAYGISTFNNGDVFLQNCSSTAFSSTGPCAGINLVSSGAVAVLNCTSQASNTSGSSSSGLAMSGFATAEATVQNCIISSSSSGGNTYGVDLAGDSRKVLSGCRISATGGAVNTVYGIRVQASDVDLSQCGVTVNEGATAYGIYHASSGGTAALTDLRINVATPASSTSSARRGISCLFGAATIKGCTVTCAAPVVAVGMEITSTNAQAHVSETNITASGATSTHALRVSNGATAVVRNCALTGATSSVSRIATAGTPVIRIAHSQLSGPVPAGITCQSNYDANLAPIACP